MNRKQAENVAKKKLDNLMKESKIRDREDPDSFTMAALPPTGKHDKSPLKVNTLYLTQTAFMERKCYHIYTLQKIKFLLSIFDLFSSKYLNIFKSRCI